MSNCHEYQCEKLTRLVTWTLKTAPNDLPEKKIKKRPQNFTFPILTSEYLDGQFVKKFTGPIYWTRFTINLLVTL